MNWTTWDDKMIDESFFTYENYRQILTEIKAKYSIHTFSSYNGGSGVIIRHDLDLGLKPAYKMMKIEKECGLTSTFFIMTTCQTYNPLSLYNRDMIKKISDNGFEIGLHFNPQVYDNQSSLFLQEMIKREVQILEGIIGKEIKSISMHNPSVYGDFVTVKEYISAYDEPFFNPEYYFSDSCMDFRGKNIFDILKKAENNLVQLLFHPLHFNKEFNNYIKIFKNFVTEEIQLMDDNFKVIKEYNDLVSDSSLIEHINLKK